MCISLDLLSVLSLDACLHNPGGQGRGPRIVEQEFDNKRESIFKHAGKGAVGAHVRV